MANLDIFIEKKAEMVFDIMNIAIIILSV